MNTETNRHEFEEWARTNTSIGLDLDMDVDDGVEHYWNHSTYAAWEAWQAAREQVTEQRDRLAEALQKLADCDWVISLPDRMDAVRSIAREALQSLTTNEL